MKRTFVKIVLMTVVCLLTAGVAMGARKHSNLNMNVGKMSDKKIQKWVDKKGWSHGFTAMPWNKTDMREFATQYAKNRELWDSVFEWMASHDLAKMPAGRYEIAGDRCFINVQDAQTKPASQSKIESHLKYIDLQYVVTGTERFGVASAEIATVSEPLRGDNIYYTAPAEKMIYGDSDPSIFFLFFPKNFHQPLLQAGRAGDVRKVVAKIEYVRD
ncbi:MAG: YhcH/YjgK/YiaL family protein [Bacteroidales bacterium]|nr:YhcH/YjgK/YiaL family protein [Bacteroidales bacterium]